MEAIKLNAIKREQGKSIIRQLRKDGYIPAVVYGGGENINIAVDAREFANKLKNLVESHIIELTVDGETINVLIKEYQKDWMRNKMIHVDFLRVIKGHEVKTHVPIKIVGAGSTLGEKAGGILEVYFHELEVVCFPRHLPNEIEVVVSNMNVGDAISVADVKLPEGVRVTNSADSVIAVIEKTKAEAAGEAQLAESEAADK